MPRPCKRRRVCEMPKCKHFGPDKGFCSNKQAINMTVDEYESIRLIDLEGLTQEQCSERMNVARTTVQSIYNNARAKLAKCLVQGSELIIDGGEYTLCDGSTEACNCIHQCHKHCRHNE